MCSDINKISELISTSKLQSATATASSSYSCITTTNNNTNNSSSAGDYSSSAINSSTIIGDSTGAVGCNSVATSINGACSTSIDNQYPLQPNEYLLCDTFPKSETYSFIKITIKPNNENTPIRIKSIRLFGIKNELNRKPTVQDVSICWFFDILSSIALLQSQIMPTMFTNLINISKYVCFIS